MATEGKGSSRAGNPGRKAGGDSRSAVKQRFLEQLHGGASVKAALEAVDRSRYTYADWRKDDPEFSAEVDRIRKLHKDAVVEPAPWMAFTEFSDRYLGQQVFPHTQNVVDMIEGQEPSWLHPSMNWEQGEPDLVIANMPPEHGKSAAITINYVTYRIAMDPNVRIIIVSKTQTMARKFLYAIKTRLTHPKFADMHIRYGPAGGYDKNSESWSADRIYVSADSRDSGEKDPTVEALGIGSHIYGARADLIIVDDAVDTSNAHQFDRHIDWLQGEVMSRISASGSMLIVGTRLASRDLYLELRDPNRYPEEKSPWSYLSMPAVLDYADDPKDWVTLWPRSNVPELGDRHAVEDADGLYPKWDGPRLAKKRNRVSPRAWSLIYQQQQVSDDMIFTNEMVRGCTNNGRSVGPLKDFPGVRKQGMSGLVVVGGLDPATTGHTAAVVAALDPVTHKRWVLDMKNTAGMGSDEMKSMLFDLAVKYNMVEWRIEQNAFQGFLVYDTELNQSLASVGCVVKPHQTGSNKHDAEFGVAAMAGLMAGHEKGNNLLDLPGAFRAEVVRELQNQLVTWSPSVLRGSTKHHFDLVMALWFAMLACADRDQWGRRSHHAQGNPFTSPRDLNTQEVVNIDDLLAEQEREMFEYTPSF